MRWLGRPAVAADDVDAPEAYREGRADEGARVERDMTGARVVDPVVDRRDVEEAYARGRREERLRRRSSPFLVVITAILVLIALVFIYLAARTGSFSGAGSVIDNMIQAPVHGAADQAGNALVNAGENLKDKAGSGTK